VVHRGQVAKHVEVEVVPQGAAGLNNTLRLDEKRVFPAVDVLIAAKFRFQILDSVLEYIAHNGKLVNW